MTQSGEIQLFPHFRPTDALAWVKETGRIDLVLESCKECSSHWSGRFTRNVQGMSLEGIKPVQTGHFDWVMI